MVERHRCKQARVPIRTDILLLTSLPFFVYLFIIIYLLFSFPTLLAIANPYVHRPAGTRETISGPVNELRMRAQNCIRFRLVCFRV